MFTTPVTISDIVDKMCSFGYYKNQRSCYVTVHRKIKGLSVLPIGRTGQKYLYSAEDANRIYDSLIKITPGNESYFTNEEMIKIEKYCKVNHSSKELLSNIAIREYIKRHPYEFMDKGELIEELTQRDKNLDLPSGFYDPDFYN